MVKNKTIGELLMLGVSIQILLGIIVGIDMAVDFIGLEGRNTVINILSIIGVPISILTVWAGFRLIKK